MTRFEEQLKEALARREPPEDFTARVLARVNKGPGERPESKWQAWFRAPAARRLAGAAVCAVLLAASGSFVYEQHERQVRGEAAKEKLMTAVRIAGVKLQKVHRHVLNAGAVEADQ